MDWKRSTLHVKCQNDLWSLLIGRISFSARATLHFLFCTTNESITLSPIVMFRNVQSTISDSPFFQVRHLDEVPSSLNF